MTDKMRVVKACVMGDILLVDRFGRVYPAAPSRLHGTGVWSRLLRWFYHERVLGVAMTDAVPGSSVHDANEAGRDK